jgi:hypothetical protein
VIKIASKNGYTELLTLMRKQGAKDNPTTLVLGVMRGLSSLKVGNLMLDKEDIYVAEDLSKSGLVQGDMVAVMKLNNCDKYVILAKVVSL